MLKFEVFVTTSICFHVIFLAEMIFSSIPANIWRKLWFLQPAYIHKPGSIRPTNDRFPSSFILKKTKWGLSFTSAHYLCEVYTCCLTWPPLTFYILPLEILPKVERESFVKALPAPFSVWYSLFCYKNEPVQWFNEHIAVNLQVVKRVGKRDKRL